MMVHLGKNNSMHQYLIGANPLGSSSAEKDQGVLVDKRLSISQNYVPVAKKASGILWCIEKSIASRSRGLLSSSSIQPW